MNKNTIDIGTACEIIMSAEHWNPLDNVVELNSMYYTFFRSNLTSVESKSIRQAMIDLWNKDACFRDGIQRSGYVVLDKVKFEHGEKYRRKINTFSPDSDSVIGMAFGSIKELTENYKFAKTVLHAMGICQAHSSSLVLSEESEEYIKIKNTRSYSHSAIKTVVNKLLGGLGISNHEISISGETRQTHQAEILNEIEIGKGAVSSALILNAISGCLNITSISDMIKIRAVNEMKTTRFESSIDEQNEVALRLNEHHAIIRSAALNYVDEIALSLINSTKGYPATKEEQLWIRDVAYSMVEIKGKMESEDISPDLLKAIDAFKKLCDQKWAPSWLKNSGDFIVHCSVLMAGYTSCINDIKDSINHLAKQDITELNDDCIIQSYIKWNISETKRMRERDISSKNHSKLIN